MEDLGSQNNDSQIGTPMDSQIGTPMDSQIGTPTGTPMDSQMGSQTGRQTGRQTDSQTGGQKTFKLYNFDGITAQGHPDYIKKVKNLLKDLVRYINDINNYSVKDLLERGIDSQHDFSKLNEKDSEYALKKEIFDSFVPENFDDSMMTDTYHEEYDRYIVTLAVKLFEVFNTKVTEKIAKTAPKYTISNSISNPPISNPPIVIPFSPRIKKRVKIDKTHNPFANSSESGARWENNAKMYYIAGNTEEFQSNKPNTANTGYHSANLFNIVKTHNSKHKSNKELYKHIIIFQDSQGASNSIFGFLDNITMRPGSFYSSFEKYVLDLKKQTPSGLGKFINDLNTLKTLKVTAKDLDNDLVKTSLYNIMKKHLFNIELTNLMSSGDKTGWTMNTPAQLIDAGGSNTLKKEEFLDDLIKINHKINVPVKYNLVKQSINDIANDNNNNWSSIPGGINQAYAEKNFIHLKPIWRKQGKGKGNDFISGLDNTIFDRNKFHYINDKNMDNSMHSIKNNITKLYRVMYDDKNILHNTYDGHFDKVCKNKPREKFPKLNYTKIILNKFYHIQFEMVLGEETNKTDGDNLVPYLLMSYFHHDEKVSQTQNPQHKKNNTKHIIVMACIPYTGLGEINSIKSTLEIIYKKHKKSSNSELEEDKTNFLKAQKKNPYYAQIYIFIDYWIHNGMINKENNNWGTPITNAVFLRLLYTFKMMGDHGQVKYINELKNIPNFNKYFEVLFTTGDALASLYACEHKVTNMSTIMTDFPSLLYCKSNPSGMIYYPSS
jgi:hypothetical protein